MTKEQAMKVLEEHNQTHVMRGFDDLTSSQQETLLNQIADLQWDDIALAGNDISNYTLAEEGFLLERLHQLREWM